MAKLAKNTNVSDAAVKKATGKTWDQWFKVIDKFGGKKMSHKEIAGCLYYNHLKNGWWCQSITVVYERARGLRNVGQNAGKTYDVSAQKTFSLSPKKAWDLVTSEEGTKIWLGPATDVEYKPGKIFELSKGQVGEMRVITPNKMIRFKWHEHKTSAGSFVLIAFVPQGSKTAINFTQEKLKSQKERTKMKVHWTKVLEKLYALAEGV